MKRVIAAIATTTVLAWALSTTTAMAKDKEVTIQGDAKCAMCMLHEGDACKTVIQTTKAGKTTTYYLVDNDVSKAFHDDVCHGAKKVVAKGTVAEVDGKQKLTLTKIEIAKK
ncbi:MAG TPA: DUF6370 family protein [Candidatus Limnocylindrales bacterium]|jgi:hypothetical protein|nr:DUF6370 family protein [Candidatus Limnocylindrales bacterium]